MPANRNKITETICGNMPPFLSQPQPQIFHTTLNFEMSFRCYETQVPLYTTIINTEGLEMCGRAILSHSNYSQTYFFLMRGDGGWDLNTLLMSLVLNLISFFHGMWKQPVSSLEFDVSRLMCTASIPFLSSSPPLCNQAAFCRFSHLSLFSVTADKAW